MQGREAVIDLAGARFPSTKGVRDWHVRDAFEAPLQAVAELAFHALRALDVVLQKNIS